MSKILYHYTNPANRDSIRRLGLSGVYDQTVGATGEEADPGDGPGVVYLIDRLGEGQAEDLGRDLWQQDRERDELPQGATDEEARAYFEAKRPRDSAWLSSMRRALSRGDLTPEEATKRGWHNLEPSEWRKLPETLYHVTTNAGGVMASGLKTRHEQGLWVGAGLGGGQGDAISFTEDLKIAEAIASGLREMHDVANGKIGVADMLEAAHSGAGASKPFLADLLRGWAKDWQVGDALPRGVQAMLEGKHVGWGKLGSPPDAEHAWTAMEADAANAVWVGGDGKTYANYYERQATEEERLEDRVEMFKRFAAFREWAGGAYDPLFFGSDTQALAVMDKAKIQILQVRTALGAQGYRMGGMGEWRTGSGEAVVVQGVVEAGRLKPVGSDVWAVDTEGLELEEDIMWTGSGRSWTVEGMVAPERLVLLSADLDLAVAASEHCLGHTQEEIKEVVVQVGDKWEAAFRLWREIEPDSDVPRCRNLLGSFDFSDPFPPTEVRALVGLDEKGEPTGLSPWVVAPHELLGAGEDRFAVALCQDHVLKVDPYWLSSTNHEVEAWGKASARLRKILAPVMAHGEEGCYGWVVMPRCQRLEVVDAKMRAEVDEVLGLGHSFDENLGLLDGHLVILDYGTSDESGPVVHQSEAGPERLGMEAGLEV